MKQTQTQAVHTWCRSKRRKHAQKGIRREKQAVGWKRENRKDIIKKTMDEGEALMSSGFLLIWKKTKTKKKTKSEEK